MCIRMLASAPEYRDYDDLWWLYSVAVNRHLWPSLDDMTELDWRIIETELVQTMEGMLA